MVNAELKESDIKALCCKAKNNILLENKIKQLHKTLNVYKGYNQKTDQEKEEVRKQNIILYNEIQDIRNKKNLYQECIKTMSDLYKIPQGSIEKILNYIVDKVEVKAKENN